MIAEILITGDEIRSGSLVDRNSAYIAQMLEEAGTQVVRHSCVGDDHERIVTVLQEISARSNIAVVTGGLGPTVDDITAAAAAKAADVEMLLNPRALKSIKRFFQRRRRPFTDSNKKQAILPAGAECLCNPVGTAPGFQLRIGQTDFFFLPGVPSEMQHLLNSEVIPRVLTMQAEDRSNRLTVTLSTFGLTESATNEQLSGFEHLFPQIKLGFQVKFPEIHVKLYAVGPNEDLLQSQLQKAVHWIYEKLGPKVFSDTGESLEKAVGHLLYEKHATLAVAESCTGGLISDLITNVPGSSDYFILTTVTYSNQAKMEILGVAAETLNRQGAVAEKTAKEMALGVKRLSGATYGLSTSGVAGPGGATDAKPVGTVCIGLATSRSVIGRRFNFNFNDRRMNKQIFAATALELLRQELLSSGGKT
jgi:nicotinamide-nucleotide amidase